jgi:flagella basal body P-ring formation protein FlgA
MGPGLVQTEVSHISKEDPSGHFFVSFRLRLDGHPAGQARVDMEGIWSGKLLQTREPMGRHAVPRGDQMDLVQIDGIKPAGALTTLPEGMRLRVPLPSGHLLSQSDLEAIPVIAPGDKVRLEVVSGSLTLALDATARSGGAVNEKIRLALDGSGKIVMAYVTAPQQARMIWSGK